MNIRLPESSLVLVEILSATITITDTVGAVELDDAQFRTAEKTNVFVRIFVRLVR